MMSRFESALASTLLLSACQSTSEPKPVAPAQVIARPAGSPATAEAHDDAGSSDQGPVRTLANEDAGTWLEGVAQNAKAGAVLETTTGGPVYIRGLNSWPSKLEGKRLRASGHIRTIHHADPCPRPGDKCMAGLSGDQRVLENAKFTDESGNPIEVLP